VDLFRAESSKAIIKLFILDPLHKWKVFLMRNCLPDLFYGFCLLIELYLNSRISFDILIVKSEADNDFDFVMFFCRYFYSVDETDYCSSYRGGF
jgi:hypothetical protein